MNLFLFSLQKIISLIWWTSEKFNSKNNQHIFQSYESYTLMRKNIYVKIIPSRVSTYRSLIIWTTVLFNLPAEIPDLQ